MKTPIEHLIEKLEENRFLSKFERAHVKQFRKELDQIIAESKELERKRLFDLLEYLDTIDMEIFDGMDHEDMVSGFEANGG